jgi:hypothetical protein
MPVWWPVNLVKWQVARRRAEKLLQPFPGLRIGHVVDHPVGRKPVVRAMMGRVVRERQTDQRGAIDRDLARAGEIDHPRPKSVVLRLLAGLPRLVQEEGREVGQLDAVRLARPEVQPDRPARRIDHLQRRQVSRRLGIGPVPLAAQLLREVMTVRQEVIHPENGLVDELLDIDRCQARVQRRLDAEDVGQARLLGRVRRRQRARASDGETQEPTPPGYLPPPSRPTRRRKRYGYRPSSRQCR